MRQVVPRSLLRSVAPCVVMIAALAMAALPAAAPASADDPLSRPEFRKEISIAMSDMDVAAVFRAIAVATGVPFILDFTPESSLRISIEATNMGCRGILESLSSSYSLEYVDSPTGVVVRRTGAASSDAPSVASPPGAATATRYWFDLYLRGADGRVERFQRSFREGRRVESGVFHLSERDATVPVLNRATAVVEDASVGAFELALGVSRDDGASLTVVAELVERRSLGPRRYEEQHTISSARLSLAETRLFRTAHGDSIVVGAWGRVPDSARGAGAH